MLATSWSTGEAGIPHQVVNYLNAEGGFLRIAELANLHLGQHTNDESEKLFDDLSLPFLQAITHEEVLASLLMEKPISDIYNFLYGPQGRREATLFSSFSASLKAKAHSSITARENENLYSCTDVVLRALGKLLECNQASAVDAGLHPVVDAMQECMDSAQTLVKGTLVEQSASLSMLKVRRYLNYGASISNLPQPVLSNITKKTAFQLTTEGPRLAR